MSNKTTKLGGLFKGLAAFIGLPLFFVFIAYLAIYFIAGPIIAPATSLLSLFIGERVPNFTNGLPVDNEVLFIPVDTEQENVIQVADITLPKTGEVYAHISIPGTGVDCDVYYGDSNKILKKGPGQSVVSILPGFGGTTLVGAHVTSHFKGLKHVKVGDIIYYQTSYGAYEYQVTNIQIAEPSVAEKTKIYDLGLERDNLVLYTCYPFHAVAFRSQRYFVCADLISGPSVNIYVD